MRDASLISVEMFLEVQILNIGNGMFSSNLAKEYSGTYTSLFYPKETILTLTIKISF